MLPRAGASARGERRQAGPPPCNAPGPGYETKPAAHQHPVSTAGRRGPPGLTAPRGPAGGHGVPFPEPRGLGPGHTRPPEACRAHAKAPGYELGGAVRPPGLRLRGAACYSRTGGSTVPPLCKYEVVTEDGGPAGLGSPCPFGPAPFCALWGEAPPGPGQGVSLPVCAQACGDRGHCVTSLSPSRPAQLPPPGGTCHCRRLQQLPLLRAERICRPRSLPAGGGGGRDTQGLSGADTAFRPSPWPVTLAGAGLGAPGFCQYYALRPRGWRRGGVSVNLTRSLSVTCAHSTRWRAPACLAVCGAAARGR